MNVDCYSLEDFIKKTKLCFVATVNSDGSPNLSPKASLEVWDQNHVVFAHIDSFKTIENLASRPKTVLNIVDFLKRKGIRLDGEATTCYPGSPEYDFIAQPIWQNHGRQYPVHCAVKIKVHSMSPLLSPAYRYGADTTEKNLAEHFLTYYKDQL
ncbi:MAG: pyridoxamine 5'-phosphate oxidase family protein [Marinoscillum sp.]